jgi:Tol biopolymer transport system component
MRNTILMFLVILTLIVLNPLAFAQDDADVPMQQIVFIVWDAVTEEYQFKLINIDGTGLRTFEAIEDITLGGFSWSPDGQRMIYSCDYDLCLYDFESEEQRRIADQGGWEFSPSFFSDNERIAFLLDGADDVRAMAILSLTTGELQLIEQGGEVPAMARTSGTLAVAQHEDLIAFSSRSGDDEASIFITRIDGTVIDAIFQVDGGNGFATQPRWSPDGSTIAFTGESEMRSGFAIQLWDLEARTLRPLNPQSIAPGDELQASWSPDGQSIAFTLGSGLYITNVATGEYQLVYESASQRMYEMHWRPLPNATD